MERLIDILTRFWDRVTQGRARRAQADADAAADAVREMEGQDAELKKRVPPPVPGGDR